MSRRNTHFANDSVRLVSEFRNCSYRLSTKLYIYIQVLSTPQGKNMRQIAPSAETNQRVRVFIAHPPFTIYTFPIFGNSIWKGVTKGRRIGRGWSTWYVKLNRQGVAGLGARDSDWGVRPGPPLGDLHSLLPKSDEFRLLSPQ